MAWQCARRASRCRRGTRVFSTASSHCVPAPYPRTNTRSSKSAAQSAHRPEAFSSMEWPDRDDRVPEAGIVGKVAGSAFNPSRLLEVKPAINRSSEIVEMLGETLLNDSRLALRGLARRPLFSVIVVATLALGIATATAMFTLVDGIVLRPLPYPRPERLVEVMQSYPEKSLDRWTLSQQNAATYLDLK